MTAELPQDLDSNRPYVGGMGAQLPAKIGCCSLTVFSVEGTRE